MKRLFALAVSIAMLATFSVSCNYDPLPETIVRGTAYFTSFGFYAADNEALTEDYIAEKIESRMVLLLPKAVDKSALIARFTTLDDNEVYVGQTLQVSGVTPNDFNYFVDYVVMQPASGVRKMAVREYEIKTGNMLVMKLDHLASYTTPDHLIDNELAGAVNPKDNSYYIFYESKEKDELDKDIYKGYVIKWNGTEFEKVGTDSATKAGAGSFDIQIDPNGIPYVLYVNSGRYVNGVADTETNGYASMRKLLGGVWTDVGSDVFGTTGKPNSSYMSFGIEPSTKYPVVGWHNNTNNISIPRRYLTMHYYSTTGWDADNLINDIKGNLYSIGFKNVGNEMYMGGYIQGGDDSPNFFAYKYNGSQSWQNIFTILGSEIGQSTGTAYPTYFYTDNNGTIYYSTSSNPEGSWQVGIYRYDPESAKLEPVGGDLGISSNSNTNVKLSFDGKNNPVLFYKEGAAGIPYLRPLDPSTQQWAPPVAVSNELASRLIITTDANGDAYLSFSYKLPDLDEQVQGYCIDTYTFRLVEDEDEVEDDGGE